MLEAIEQQQSPWLTDKNMPSKQRALVFQGGGAMGAYEVGVIKKLHEKLTRKDGKIV
jgi:predicted acylesterase/phospholipase RssA